MRALIQQLQAEHQDILRLGRGLEEGLKEGSWRMDPRPLKGDLDVFLAAVAAHLDLEDGHFYPEAEVHPEAGALARRYREDLGHLRGTAAAYLEAWSTPEAILANPTGFADYTGAFLRFLHRRITVEEEELYPALGGPGAEGLP